MAPPPSPRPPIPLLLLKSPSPSPASDPYTLALPPPTYTPHFIPILTHTLLPDALISLLLTHLTPSPPTFPFAAIILTSQRAVACLATALSAPPIQRLPPSRLQQLSIRLYAVGPATAGALRDVRDRYLPSCSVHGGGDAGSGEALAGMIIREGGLGGLRLLFLAGEKRRDVIPRMLMDGALGAGRVEVEEVVGYRSGEREDFEFSFGRVVGETEGEGEHGGAGVRWVVIFSPQGGMGMLKGLGWWDELKGRVRAGLEEGRRTFVCAIGPTTRGYLRDECGFEVDVVAERPSPEGVREGVEAFMREKGLVNG